MTRYLVLAATGTLALAASACKEPASTVTQNQPQTGEAVSDEPGVANLPANAAAPAGLPTTAPEFAALAAGSDLFEISTGRLAEQKGGSAGVKSFGAQLVEEHTKSSAELKAALAKVQPPIPLPTTPPAELQAKVQALQGLNGEGFDRQFITNQIASHQQTLAALNAYVASGDNPALRDFAAKATGMVQKHLQQLNRMSQQ
jgi:putative membrane protein